MKDLIYALAAVGLIAVMCRCTDNPNRPMINVVCKLPVDTSACEPTDSAESNRVDSVPANWQESCRPLWDEQIP